MSLRLGKMIEGIPKDWTLGQEIRKQMLDVLNDKAREHASEKIDEKEPENLESGEGSESKENSEKSE